MRIPLRVRVSMVLIVGVLVSTGAAVAASAYVQNQRLQEMAKEETLSLSTTLARGIEAAEAATEAHMLTATRFVALEQARTPLTNADLGAMTKVVETDAIYVANKDGVFTHSNDAGSIGFNLYSIAPAYKNLVTGSANIIEEPLKLRAQDGKTAKFLAVPLADRSGFVEVSVIVD
ncbi:MAG TPA: hypothetical protein VNT75_15040, partial [Symbiobacteriaceae bacterium]|nr:hypothetical protein [Symbiobacteriaceae bacterium]